MNKIVLILVVLFTTLFGVDKFDITQVTSQKNIKDQLWCQADSDDTFTFEEVLKSENLQKIKKTNLGYLHQTYWCRFEVFNSSDVHKSIVFVNPRPGMDYIDVKVFKESETDSFILGDMVSPENRSYASVFNNFELKLQTKESATVVVKYKSVGNLEVSWIAYDLKSFFLNESINFILIFSMFGFFFAMMIYKTFVYFHIKDKAYLIYAFSIGSIIISQASLQGTLHFFLYEYIDSFTITLLCWNMTHLFLVFLWIFTYYFFNITKQSRFYYPMLIVIAYNILTTIFYTTSYVWSDALQFTPLIAKLAFVESLLLVFFSFTMFLQKKAGSGYFLVGHLLYILSVFIYILNLQGTVEFSLLNHHSTAIGLFLVILFMSLALSQKFKVLKDENEKQKGLIEKNKQYAMIGTTIAFVSHQWKQPLSVLSAQTTSLLAYIEHKPTTQIVDIVNKVEALENSIIYINDTLDTIKKLFTASNEQNQVIQLKDVFEAIRSELEEKVRLNSIDLHINVDDSLRVEGKKNLIIHALSNIVDNSIDAFEEKQLDKKINLSAVKSSETELVIIIADNAGGIKVSPIEDIFNPHISTKTFGTGIGLAFTKNIIESKFRGSIDVINTEGGALFTVKIPQITS